MTGSSTIQPRILRAAVKVNPPMCSIPSDWDTNATPQIIAVSRRRKLLRNFLMSILNIQHRMQEGSGPFV